MRGSNALRMGAAAMALGAGLASGWASALGVAPSPQEIAPAAEKIRAAVLRPSGERRIFGYVVEVAEVALTSGPKLVELAPAKIEGEATVDELGHAKAKLSVAASTKMGRLDILIDVQGQEGDEFDAVFAVGGKPMPAHVRIAKLDGCEEKVCPAALRADFMDLDKSVSVDVYSPVRK